MTAFDRRTALVVVDVQNDFADPAGALYVAGGEDVVPIVNRVAWTAVRDGAFVAYTADWHPERTPHFTTDGGIWPAHCVGGTWGAAFHPALDVIGPWVRKGTGGEDGYSGFAVRDPASGAETPTELGDLLRVRGIERVVVCGLATDYCVQATALDGVRLGFQVEVLEDAVAAVELAPGDGAAAVAAMVAAGVTLHRAGAT